jgi:hypothetical protein
MSLLCLWHIVAANQLCLLHVLAAGIGGRVSKQKGVPRSDGRDLHAARACLEVGVVQCPGRVRREHHGGHLPPSWLRQWTAAATAARRLLVNHDRGGFL